MKQILLVEDDATIRSIFAAVLVEDGYVVTEAGDAYRALEVARANPTLALIVTDNRMPMMMGTQFIAAVHAFAPTMPILCISGRSPDPEEMARVSRTGTVRWLMKPIRPEQLTAVVSEMIRRPLDASEPGPYRGAASPADDKSKSG